MNAIVKISGKQYKVSKGDILKINRQEWKVGDKVKIDEVLLTDNKGKIAVGAAMGVENNAYIRLQELIKSDVDIIFIDVAHEHTKTTIDFIKKAKKKLPKETWDYLIGASETETTFKRNRFALDNIAFRPRILRDVENVDL